MKPIGYRQRLMLTVAGYTCLVAVICLSAVWYVVEQMEAEEAHRTRTHLQSLLAMSRQINPENPQIIRAGNLTYYPSAQSLPPDLPDSATLITGQVTGGEQPYYLRVDDDAPRGDFEREFDDLLFVFSGVLLCIGVAVFMVWYMARRLAAPVLELQAQVRRMDARSGELPLLERDDEIGELSQAFGEALSRVRQYAQREHEFTRFASHELRTPATVIRGNIDLLAEVLPDSRMNRRILTRLQVSTNRLMRLIETFLWLGREYKDCDPLPFEQLDAPSLRRLFAETLDALAERDRERVLLDIAGESWHLRPVLLSIVFENLIRNALQHGQGEIRVQVDNDRLIVDNSSLPEAVDSRQMGIGLQIVQRVCEASGWVLCVVDDGRSYHVTIDLDG